MDGLEENIHYSDCLYDVSRLCAETSNQIQLFLSSQTALQLSSTVPTVLSEATILEMTSYNATDIAKFVTKQTDSLFERKPELKTQSEKIEMQLNKKAGGMFQWVKTITDQLIVDAQPENIDQVLEDLPSGLVNTWNRVFMRFNQKSQRNREKIQRTLLWLFVAARPLSAIELKVAIDFPRDVQSMPRWDSDHYGILPESDASFAQELDELLGPLIEIHLASDSLHYVQMAHPSLRTALTANHLSAEDALASYTFDSGDAHSSAAMTCMQLCSISSLALANSFGSRPAFFILYA